MRISRLLYFAALPLAAATCDDLTKLSTPHTVVTSAQTIAAGAFTAPDAPANDPALPAYRKLPAFCRVQGVIQPSTDSHIEFEVWLPSSAWNGKYAGVGNGGFAGAIGYPGLAAALLAGFASSATDTGHRADATDAAWAIGHPEKLVDFGYRAIHETADQAKAVARAFYDRSPQRSYFSACSNGGRQGLMEAQRYPADYDGIIAGAPANFFTHVGDSFVWDLQAIEADPASYIPETKLPAIESAVLQACDAKDGLTDGLIDDPRKCRFDPAVLLCRGAESAGCLTQPQVTALKKIYAGPRDSKGTRIYPGFLPGGETGNGGWAAWITGPAPMKSAQYAFGMGIGSVLFEDPKWDYRTFNFDRDVALLDKKLGKILNANDPDLKAFQSHGGKLVIYHGWSDSALPPENTIDYYQRVVSKMGSREAAGFIELYMVPGMQHCGGGPGPNNFGSGMFTAMEDWVEKGTVPGSIIAKNAARTRPLCPWPQVARYNGSGSVDEAANFTCSIPSTPR